MEKLSGDKAPEQVQPLSKSKRKRLRKKLNKQGPQEDGGEAQASILEVKELETSLPEEFKADILAVDETAQKKLPILAEKIVFQAPAPVAEPKQNSEIKEPQKSVKKEKCTVPEEKVLVQVPHPQLKGDENSYLKTKPVVQLKSDSKMADAEKSREEIMAARKAKKAAKKGPKEDKKEKPKADAVKVEVKMAAKTEPKAPAKQLMAEGKENKEVKSTQAKPIEEKPKPAESKLKPTEVKLEAKPSEAPQKSNKELKEERRQKQEAQRAAKAAAAAAKAAEDEPQLKASAPAAAKAPVKKIGKANSSLQGLARTVAALKKEKPANEQSTDDIHPAFVKLGVQLQNRVVSGCTARAVALMRALGQLVHDYETPEHIELRRHLAQVVQQHMDYLDKRRPNSVSMVQAVRSLRINALPYGTTEAEAKEAISTASEMFLLKLQNDAKCVRLNLAEKMAPGDTVLVYSFSSLLLSVLTKLAENLDFRVVVVGSKTHKDGLKMVHSLVQEGIDCTYVLVNQVNFVMSQVQLVLLGAESMLANSSMIGRAGCAQVATMAKSQGVPVYACCETYNFSYESHLSPFYLQNEAEPDLIAPRLRKVANLSQCSLLYDVVPERLLTAIVTEVAVLPCSSVPVVLHMQSADTVLKSRTES